MPACSCYLEQQNINPLMDRQRQRQRTHPSEDWQCDPGTRACKLRTAETTMIFVLMFEAERSLASLLHPPGEDREKVSYVAGAGAGHGDAVVQHHVGSQAQHGVGLGNHWEQ